MHGRERLKAWMAENGKRQVDVAEAIGTGQQNVSAWLHGRAVPLDMALRLKKLTGIELEAWVDRTSAPPPSDSGTLHALGDDHKATG